MQEPNDRYHIEKEPTQPVEDRIGQATRQELERWANDPKCFEAELCARERAYRQNRSERKPVRAIEARMLAEERQGSAFNPRTEVSADAVYIVSRIVKHLWIIFILLPVVVAVLLFAVGVIK
jgi:hypothetical protein